MEPANRPRGPTHCNSMANSIALPARLVSAVDTHYFGFLKEGGELAQAGRLRIGPYGYDFACRGPMPTAWQRHLIGPGNSTLR